jgi:mRNA-degrading endonuclease RelE of RelBE toxin-antitoxin system
VNNFKVVLTEHAISDLKSISKEPRDQIHRDLRTLESNPFPFGTRIKRLRGFRPPVYRLRSGNFRALYRIQGDVVTILLRKGHKEIKNLRSRVIIQLRPSGSYCQACLSRMKTYPLYFLALTAALQHFSTATPNWGACSGPKIQYYSLTLSLFVVKNDVGR